METSWNLTTTSKFQDDYYSLYISLSYNTSSGQNLAREEHPQEISMSMNLSPETEILKVVKKFCVRSEFHITELCQWAHRAKEEVAIISALGKSYSKTLYVELPLPHLHSLDQQMKGCKRTNPTCLPSKQLLSTYSRECRV